MIRSSKPSPLTSPAEATELPLRSYAAAPLSLKPLLPLRLDRSMLAGNCGMVIPPWRGTAPSRVTIAGVRVTAPLPGDAWHQFGVVLSYLKRPHDKLRPAAASAGQFVHETAVKC
jgi:hypothetical protein